MNILVLAPHSYYVDRGSPIDVDILVQALSRRGDRVDLVVYADGEDRAYPHVTIHRPDTPGWLRHIGPGFSLRKMVADLYLFHLARTLVHANRYDVVHAVEEAAFIGLWFKRSRGLPYVYDMDSSIAQQLVEKLSWLRPVAGFLNWCEAKAIRGALAAAPVCNALADLARRRGASHIVTLHDISQLAAPGQPGTGDLRKRLQLDGAPILMYVGNLEAYQGVDLLLDAFAFAIGEGATSSLVIAGGTDPQITAYRRKAAELGLANRVHFIGGWPAPKLDELLAEADILVAPRIRGINTPMKVFPYLHSGKPVLVTDLPTHNQILTPDVALLAPPDPVGFGSAILRLSEDQGLRRSLGKAGREFVERNHTFRAHERRVNALYDHLAAHLQAAVVTRA